MKVVIIGAGNVATVLGQLIKKAGHDILQVVSRNAANAAVLAAELACPFSDNSGVMNKSADLYLVAVADAAFNERNDDFNLGDKLLLHTAGSVSKEVLKDYSTHYGVLYPLQSLRKEQPPAQVNIPLLVDGNSDEVTLMIADFAKTISTSVYNTTDNERLKLHVAAVLVNNFTNHLYTLAADFCNKEGVDFKMLLPLIEETALRLRHHSPGELQTGPAVRKDIITLDKHLKLLGAHPKLYNIYLKMTDSLMNP